MIYNNEDKFKSGIYLIKNNITNKVYIGKSMNIDKRIKQHVALLNRRDKNENIHLINSWFKYGRFNFTYEVLEYVEKNSNIEEVLAEKELYWILFYKSNERSNGYNLRLDSSTKMITHPETRERLSIALNKRYLKQEERDKLGKASKKFWKENPNIIVSMSKKVSSAKTKYTIVQFDRQMNVIKEYDSQKTIRDNYKDLYLPAILQVCNGNKASYKNYYWRYKDIITGKIVYQKPRRTVKLKVQMFDKKTHVLLNTFDSITQAATFIGECSPTNVSKMCKNKTFWKTKTYYFRTIEDIVQS